MTEGVAPEAIDGWDPGQFFYEGQKADRCVLMWVAGSVMTRWVARPGGQYEVMESYGNSCRDAFAIVDGVAAYDDEYLWDLRQKLGGGSRAATSSVFFSVPRLLSAPSRCFPFLVTSRGATHVKSRISI